MKRKELKEIAKKIAKCEKQRMQLESADNPDTKKIKFVESEIMELAGRAESLEDMVAIDELVQEILS